jgi:hypothetical protein
MLLGQNMVRITMHYVHCNCVTTVHFKRMCSLFKVSAKNVPHC